MVTWLKKQHRLERSGTVDQKSVTWEQFPFFIVQYSNLNSNVLRKGH